MVYETADGLTILDSVPACGCHHGHDHHHDAESPTGMEIKYHLVY